MADTVVFTAGADASPPANTIVATDDAGAAGQVQIVKLAISADGSATIIPGDAANGLDVDVTRLPALPAGTNNIGDVDVLTLPALPAGTNNIGDVDIASIAAGDNNIGNVDVVTLPALPAGTNNIGDVDVLTVPADPFGVNADAASATGSISAKLRAIAVNGIPVTGTVTVGAHAVTNAGTFPVQVDAALPAGANAIGKLAANSGVDIGDVDVASLVPGTGATNLGKAEDAVHTTGDVGVLALGVRRDTAVQSAGTDGDYTAPIFDANGHLWATLGTAATVIGNVAHDTAAAQAPVRVGAKAETSPKGITLVADGDVTDLYADADGILIAKLNTANADMISERVTNTDGASTALTNFSAVASTRNYVTAYSIFRTDAGTTLAYLDFRDGTGGAVLWSVPLPAGGGANLSAAMPLFKTTANTALAFDVSAALTTVVISVSGFQSKV